MIRLGSTDLSDKLADAPQEKAGDAAMTIKQLTIDSCTEEPKVLSQIYDFVQRWRPEVPDHSIRARIYEALADGKIIRVMEGVYFGRSGPAQLLMVTGDAWEVLRKLSDGCISALITDPPGKFGRDWAGMGTTRPHAELGGRTYQQPELDAAWFREALRVLNKAQPWNTLSRRRKAKGDFPKGGAACLIRVPIENRTTHPHVQELINLAVSLGFVYYGEFLVVLDKMGMGYDVGRDLGAKWLLFHAGERNGVLWDLSVTNVVDARRVRNPAKTGVAEHEAEKDSVEFTQLIKAVSRPGDIILDPFCGRAKWAEQALGMERHVILADIDSMWIEKIGQEDFFNRRLDANYWND